jgi:trans-aconitate 2-methyltransferase
MSAKPREWDAGTYHRVSVPHQEWARSVLDRLPLNGDETVLDAGCGSGRVTAQLIERLPRGRVIAVDGSTTMIEKARESLRPQDTALVADLTELTLADPVDAVFSSAVFHWITDHEALFGALRGAMRPGAPLAAQCGGAGNVAGYLAKTAEVAGREPYARHLADLDESWFFAGAEETEARLERAGFERVRCWLEPWTVTPPEPEDFTRTICLVAHLDLLPAELHDEFVAAILDRTDEPLRLDYVRLNIEAVAA